MSFLRTKPHNLLFRSTTTAALHRLLSHSYARTPESDRFARLYPLSLTADGIQHDPAQGNHPDLLLDFMKYFPHSSSQTDTHTD